MLGRAVLVAAVLWTVSSKTYFALVDAAGLESGYDQAPVLATLYYLSWTALAFWLFRDVLAPALDRRTVLREAMMLAPILAGFALFVVYVLPLLPPVSRLRAPADPPEFMFASHWYYLPKSADILLQQTIIAALVLTAARAGYTLGAISMGLAGAFGLFHLQLVTEGFTDLYVIRFTLAATVFGSILPYLYLRLRGGFRLAYALHWGFYALDAAVTHLVLAAPPPVPL